MAEIATKPKPVVKTSATREPGIPAARLAVVVAGPRNCPMRCSSRSI